MGNIIFIWVWFKKLFIFIVLSYILFLTFQINRIYKLLVKINIFIIYINFFKRLVNDVCVLSNSYFLFIERTLFLV